jgi:aminopeptidase N
VPGTNLTRDEAARRASILRIERYDVEIDVTGGTTGDKGAFRTVTEVTFACTEPGASVFIDLVSPFVRAIELNGAALDPSTVSDGTRIELSGLASDNVLRVVADVCYMQTGEGLHRFVDPVDGETYLYTQFEVADAKRMFAVFDQPDLKARFRFTVIAPDHWQVVSNSPTPVPESLREGVARWAFSETARMSSYITALIAGPYHVERGELKSTDGRTIPLGVFCRRSLAPFLDAEEIMALTRRGFTFYEDAFDFPYPFEKYDQLFVPEFNAGAMENAGAVTFLEDYVFRSNVPDAMVARRAVTILHELAHMWFGDLVTMTWWDDLWLNESFAEYVSTLATSEATRFTGAWTSFNNLEKTWAYRQDQLPSTHPISADIRNIEDVEVNFDGITYAKGASVLKQLVAWVGRAEFEAGIRAYFRRHAWGNTTLRDLLAELEVTSGRDLTAWSREWLETAGVATLRPQVSIDADGRYSAVTVLQEAPADWPTLRAHRLGIGLYDLVESPAEDSVQRPADDSVERPTRTALERRQYIELDIDGAATHVPELVGQRQPDLLLLNDEDLAYAKIRLDERSQRTATAHVAAFTESLPRSLCWAAAWDMLRDAELTATAYVELVLGGVVTESDSTVVRTVLRQGESASRLFAAPAHREDLEQRWVDGLERIARAAAPASDAQLQLTQAFISSARGAHLDVVAALLDGTATWDGLTVDTDLRWALLRRLAATGRAGPEQIERELARDNTAAGAREAAAARAAIPTAEAKAAAWTAVVESDTLPNAMLGATIGGFAIFDQRELVRPYVEPYFAAISHLWRTRTNDTAQTIVQGMFPTIQADQFVLDRARQWLAEHPDEPPALRRLIVEGADGVARALRAQQRDAAGGPSP